MSENTTTVDTETDTADEVVEQETEAEEHDATDSPDSGDTTTDEQTDTKKPEPDNKVDRTEFVKVVKERQAARKALKDMQSQLDQLKRANEDESEKAQREAAEKATKEIEGRYKPIVVRTSARAALVGAGVTDDKVARLIKLMDLDDIEIDDDGEVSGVTEQVAALQEDYPELFAKPEQDRAARTARAADGADKPPARKKEPTTNLLLRGLRGGK